MADWRSFFTSKEFEVIKREYRGEHMRQPINNLSRKFYNEIWNILSEEYSITEVNEMLTGVEFTEDAKEVTVYYGQDIYDVFSKVTRLELKEG